MLAEMASNTDIETIYVKLLDEDVDVFRPVIAIRQKEGRYRILPVSDYQALDERWEFDPGAEVVCRHEVKEGQNVLIATMLANSQPK